MKRINLIDEIIPGTEQLISAISTEDTLLDITFTLGCSA
jgi:hypothetical protein